LEKWVKFWGNAPAEHQQQRAGGSRVSRAEESLMGTH
jgi:hypothetical protein